jgi:hypothetical protein
MGEKLSRRNVPVLEIMTLACICAACLYLSAEGLKYYQKQQSGMEFYIFIIVLLMAIFRSYSYER